MVLFLSLLGALQIRNNNGTPEGVLPKQRSNGAHEGTLAKTEQQ
jgi:hypothetical protein